MALGTCGYSQYGVYGACSIAEGGSCYDVSGVQCDVNTPLVDMCPLDYGGSGDGCQPPNLITTLINIVLAPGSVDEPLYEGQTGVQSLLFFIAFISVPWLLCAKPYILKKKMDEEALHRRGFTGVASREDHNPMLSSDVHGDWDESNSSTGDHGAGTGHEEHHDFAEIFIHQAIETIEFVLGMVSNTASYLRLWALSLAHTELATVFWEKCLLGAIESNNPLFVFFGFSIFASATFGVLICMDLLECFLHALRLMWVEFMNKFYKADGHKFMPFDFHSILKNALLE